MIRINAFVVLTFALFFLAGCLATSERRIANVKNAVAEIVAKETERTSLEARLSRLGAKIRPWVEANQFLAEITLAESQHGSRTLQIIYSVDEKGRVTQVSSEDRPPIVLTP